MPRNTSSGLVLTWFAECRRGFSPKHFRLAFIIHYCVLRSSAAASAAHHHVLHSLPRCMNGFGAVASKVVRCKAKCSYTHRVTYIHVFVCSYVSALYQMMTFLRNHTWINLIGFSCNALVLHVLQNCLCGCVCVPCVAAVFSVSCGDATTAAQLLCLQPMPSLKPSLCNLQQSKMKCIPGIFSHKVSQLNSFWWNKWMNGHYSYVKMPLVAISVLNCIFARRSIRSKYHSKHQ